MPVFVAFAAFMLLIYGNRFGLPVPPWPGLDGLFRAHRKSGQKSGVRTETIEMVLDHDSGRMEGRCLKGRFAGRDLSSLRDAELLQLLEGIGSADPQGAALLEAYLDRRFPGWRDRRAGGSARAGAQQQPRDRSGRMDHKEAYDVLGLKPGAGEADIRSAHRRLMMKLHPDQGGSTYLASRINEAKDVLLGRR